LGGDEFFLLFCLVLFFYICLFFKFLNFFPIFGLIDKGSEPPSPLGEALELRRSPCTSLSLVWKLLWSSLEGLTSVERGGVT
jgi:hypothetical protein